MLRPRNLRSSSKLGGILSVLLSGLLPIHLVSFQEVEKGFPSPQGGLISALGYIDYESVHGLDFRSHLLKRPEPFFSPQSTQLYIEALNGLRISFSLNANLVPTHGIIWREQDTIMQKDRKDCICR